MTASPEQLRLMLYDGAIRFCQTALEALGKDDYEGSYNAMMRAQKIVLELSTSLRHEVDPTLCQKLSALYTYIYRLLVDANMNRQVRPIEEALRLLEYERETWRLLMERLAKEGTGQGDGQGADIAADVSAQQTAISSLSQSA